MKRTPSIAKLILAALIAASSLIPALAAPVGQTRVSVARAGSRNMTAGFSPSADFTAQVLALTEPSLKPSALLQAAQGSDDASWLVRRALAHPQEFSTGEAKEALLAAVGPDAAAQLLAAAARVQEAARSDAWLVLGLNALKLQETSVQSEDVALKLELLRKAFLSATRGGEDEAVTVPEAVSKDLQGTLLPYKGGEGERLTQVRKGRSSQGVSHWEDVRSSWGRRLRNWTAAVMLGLGTLVAHDPVVAQTPTQTTQQVVVSEKYVAAKDINDVVAKWTPEVHLYVIGDVKMSDADLRKIAKSLSGKHWTIVLVDDSRGEKFQSPDGVWDTDSKAVEFGVHQGIFNKPRFSEQVDPRTGEQDGATFALVLEQHDLYFKGSEAHNTRGLDAATAFTGYLDQWAIAAMQANVSRTADVTNAVENTVANIDALLQQKIGAEFDKASADLKKAAAQVDLLERDAADFRQDHPSRAALATYDLAGMRAKLKSAQAAYDRGRPKEASSLLAPVLSQTSAGVQNMASFEKSYDAAKAALADAALHIPDLEAEAKDLRDAHPGLSGDIARPDVEQLRKDLKGAQKVLESDPAQAALLAQDLAAKVAAARQAIVGYANDAAVLESVSKKLAGLQSLERASAASEELLKAKQSLAEAQELYAKGSSEYSKYLNQAKVWVNGAEDTIASADQAAAAARRNLVILLSLLTLGLALTGFFLNRAVRPYKRSAQALIKDWDAALKVKLEAINGQLDKRATELIGTARGAGKLELSGETEKLAAQIRDDVGSLFILWTSAQGVLQKAQKLARPSLKNFFFPGSYKKALKTLKDEPIPFDPEEGLPMLFGHQRDWREDLLGDLKSYKPFSKSFDEIMAEFNERAGRAAGSLSVIEEATFGVTPAMEKVDASVKTVLSRQAAIAGAEDGLFLAPSLFAVLIPAATSLAAKTRAQMKTDPVGAYKNSGSDAGRMAKEAETLAQVIVDFRAAVLPGLRKNAETLAAAGLASGWIDDALNGLSGDAEKLAAKAAKASAAAGVAKLKSELDALGTQAARAVELAKALQETLEDRIGGAERLVAASRAQLGAALGLAPEKVLVEEGADPSDRVEGAKDQAAGTKKALGLGDNEAAEKALSEAARLSAEASDIVAATQRAFADQEKTVLERRSETGRVEGLVPEHETILARIVKSYAKSVLALGNGDPQHPDANGSLGDNVAEANSNLADAAAKLEKAVRSFNAGKLLLAADLLRQIKGHQDFALHRLGEIKEKEARLAKAVVDNEAALKTLEARVKEYEGSIVDDPRVMKPTLDAFAKAKAGLKEARASVEAVKGDPFQAQDELAEVKAALDHVDGNMARNDRDVFNEAARSVKAAASALAAARQLAQDAQGDGVADSSTIVGDYKELDALDRELVKAQAGLDLKHNDWHALDALADRIAGEAAKTAASLKGEMAAAETAVSAISRASSMVRKAASWSGSYGVVISGSPGDGSLAQARSYLEQGRYDEAKRAADSAYAKAKDAIDDAEAEESRRRRAEEERQERAREAERERQRALERSRSSSSGGYGGGHSSGGGGSSYGGGHSSGGGHSKW